MRVHVLFSLLLLLASSLALSQQTQAILPGTGWRTHAGNAQHTNVSPFASQAMRAVLWSTPMDLAPQYSGSSLLMHYGSPLATKNNTVVISVKTGPQDGFKLEGRKAADGSLVWTEPTDYSAPPHNWMPTCEGTITEDNKFAYPGAGGTIYVRASADDASSTVTQYCFYGLANYQANAATYNTNVKICTPISSDSNGNFVFGYRVYGATPVPLASGVARIAADGTGSWVAGTTLSGDGSANAPGVGCAAAFSNDESVAYMGIRAQGSSGLGYFVAFNASTLAPIASKRLYVPGSTTPAYILDDSTSTPMVGPDGDVYYGAWYYNGYRGFMYHWNSDLSVEKIPGHFGWDITPSLVDADLVPSYTGTSQYLILTKSNKYIEASLGGMNEVAILDPNDTMFDSISGLNTMKEVLVKLAPTPDPRGGFIEWCVNTTAVDPSSLSAIVNSEDGKCYRWDFTTNTLSEQVTLTGGLGEAYTSTIIGPDGLTYAMSNAMLFCMWDQVTPASVSADYLDIVGGDTRTGTVTLSDAATGPGARIYLSSDNAAVTVPAYVDVPSGSNTATFDIQTSTVAGATDVVVTAERFANTATVSLRVCPAAVAAGDTYSLLADDSLTVAAPGVLENDTLSCASLVLVDAPAHAASFNLGSDGSFDYTPTPGYTGTDHFTYKLVTGGTGTSAVTVNLQVYYPLASLTANYTTLVGGFGTTGKVTLSGPAPSGGSVVALSSNSPKLWAPDTVKVLLGKTVRTFSVGTGTVTSTTVVTLTASFKGVTKTLDFTLNPGGLISLSIVPSTLTGGSSAVGTVALSGPAPSGGRKVYLSSNAAEVTVPSYVVVREGNASRTFTVGTTGVTTTTLASVVARSGSVQRTVVVTVNP